MVHGEPGLVSALNSQLNPPARYAGSAGQIKPFGCACMQHGYKYWGGREGAGRSGQADIYTERSPDTAERAELVLAGIWEEKTGQVIIYISQPAVWLAGSWAGVVIMFAMNIQ